MLLLVLLSALISLISSHECIHGQIHDMYDKWETPQKYKEHPYDKSIPEGKRRLLTGTYESIRITPYYNLAGSLDGSTTNYIKQIVSAAVRYLQNSLNVIRIDGDLSVSRWCSSGRYTVGDYKNCVGWQSAGTQTCGSTTIPTSHYSSEFTYAGGWNKPATSFDKYSGVSDTDLVIYVTAVSTNCGGSTLAYASSCVSDQYGRTIAGYINFCPNSLSSQNWINDVDTTLHEITHVLIMSPSLWDKFVDSNGDALGTANTYTTSKGDGRKWLQTTELVTKAQDYFSCGTLDGLPIESDGGSGSSGAHWEAQWLPNENMGSTLFGGMTSASEFTFALAVDSGWYTANYGYAVPYYSGYESGCSWFDGCSTSISSFYQTEYRCNSGSDYGCSPDHLAIGTCVTYAGNSGGCYFRMGEESKWCTDTHGSDYRCIKTKSSSSSSNFGGSCYQMSCSGTSSVTFTVSGSSTTCTTSNEGELRLVGGTYIECPPVDVVCSDSTFTCKQGNYDSSSGTCLCYPGWTGTQCDSEDRTVKDEASDGSGSSYPNGVCVTGSSTSALNGEWSYAGDHEYFPYYTYNGYYLYHNSWQHNWYFGTSLGSATSYTTSSNCGEKVMDVSECSGKFADSGITISSDCSNGGGGGTTPVKSPTTNPSVRPTSKPTFRPTSKPLDGDDATRMLDWHNYYRRLVSQGLQECANGVNCPAATDMTHMQWDIAVAKVATAYAESLANACTFAHNSNRNSQTCAYESDISFGHNCNNLAGTVGLGENIAMYSTSTADVIDTIEGWVTKEYNLYTYSNNYQSAAGHFSQVVWADSTHLGCGVGRSSCGTYVVCNYYTPGNYGNQYPYTSGSTCTSCPTNSVCDNHLCKFNFDDGSTSNTPKPTDRKSPTGEPTKRPTPQPIEPTPKPTAQPTGTNCGITVTGFNYGILNGDFPVYNDAFGTHKKPAYGPNDNNMYIYYLSGTWYLVQGQDYIFDGTTSWSISYWATCQKSDSYALTSCEGDDWRTNGGSVIIQMSCSGDKVVTTTTKAASDTSASGVTGSGFAHSYFNGYYPTFSDAWGTAQRPIYGPNTNGIYVHFNSQHKTWYATAGGASIQDSYSQGGIYASCAGDTTLTACPSWGGNYGGGTSTKFYAASTYNVEDSSSNSKSDIGIGIVIGLSIMLGIILIGWLIYYCYNKRKNNKFRVVEMNNQSTTPYVAMN